MTVLGSSSVFCTWPLQFSKRPFPVVLNTFVGLCEYLLNLTEYAEAGLPLPVVDGVAFNNSTVQLGPVRELLR